MSDIEHDPAYPAAPRACGCPAWAHGPGAACVGQNPVPCPVNVLSDEERHQLMAGGAALSCIDPRIGSQRGEYGEQCADTDGMAREQDSLHNLLREYNPRAASSTESGVCITRAPAELRPPPEHDEHELHWLGCGKSSDIAEWTGRDWKMMGEDGLFSPSYLASLGHRYLGPAEWRQADKSWRELAGSAVENQQQAVEAMKLAAAASDEARARIAELEAEVRMLTAKLLPPIQRATIADATGSRPLLSVTSDARMSDHDNKDAQDRVERVIEDLTKGRVIKPQVEKLGRAVDQAKRDQAVQDAAGKVWR